MADLQTIQNLYFLGIGGIGMSALARYFAFHGKLVSGYDRSESALTRALQQEGINVHYNDDPSSIPADIDLVIYTPAIPSTSAVFTQCVERRLMMIKRSQALGLITADSFTICIAGTHGKTTISTMIAHLLRDSGYGCNAFLGGIATNYETNFWYSKRKLAVIEADEYDRSFLQLQPDIAVISSTDADHLDIYHSADRLNEAFLEFSKRIKPNGRLYAKKGLPLDFSAPERLTYAEFSDEADIYARDIIQRPGGYDFIVQGPDWQLAHIQLNMGGLHNLGNMVVAIAIAKYLGIEDGKIRRAVSSFKGVKRRFELVAQSAHKNIIYLDDYAHHPGELEALISGARSSFPGYEICLLFQPHLFSRTLDFADGFARVLDKADHSILLPIYPARELPVEGVSSEIIARRMEKQAELVAYEDVSFQVKKIVENQKKEASLLIITAGAGDIDRLIHPIKKIIEEIR